MRGNSFRVSEGSSIHVFFFFFRVTAVENAGTDFSTVFF